MTTNEPPDRSSGRSAELQRLLDEAAGIGGTSPQDPHDAAAANRAQPADLDQPGDDAHGGVVEPAAPDLPAMTGLTITGHQTDPAPAVQASSPARVARRARMLAKAAEADKAAAHGVSPARAMRVMSLSAPAAVAFDPHSATAAGPPGPTWADAHVVETDTAAGPSDDLPLRGGPDYPMQVARGAILAGASPRPEPQSEVAEPRPRNQRKALLLAGGVAAAVVAIVAITVGGHLGSGPATADVGSPSQVALVQTTGADGKVTQVTVTAPTSTVGGRLVALVTAADGSVQQLTVVNLVDTTQNTTTPSTTSGLATTRATTPTTQLDVAGTSRSAAGTTRSTTTTDPTGTRSTTAPRASTSRATAGQPGSDDTATVVVGTTKLSGWVLLTTPSPTGPVPTGNADSAGPLVPPVSKRAGQPTPRTTAPAGGSAGTGSGGSGAGTSSRATLPTGGPAGSTSSAPAPGTTSQNPTSAPPPATTEPATDPPVTTAPETSDPETSAAGTTPDDPTTDPQTTCVAVSAPDLPVIGGVLPTAVICP